MRHISGLFSCMMQVLQISFANSQETIKHSSSTYIHICSDQIHKQFFVLISIPFFPNLLRSPRPIYHSQTRQFILHHSTYLIKSERSSVHGKSLLASLRGWNCHLIWQKKEKEVARYARFNANIIKTGKLPTFFSVWFSFLNRFVKVNFKQMTATRRGRDTDTLIMSTFPTRSSHK